MKLNPEYELRKIRLSLHSQNHKNLIKYQITVKICFILSFLLYGHEDYPSLFSKKLSFISFFERKRKFKLIIMFYFKAQHFSEKRAE